jgi:hypothetical protein
LPACCVADGRVTEEALVDALIPPEARSHLQPKVIIRFDKLPSIFAARFQASLHHSLVLGRSWATGFIVRVATKTTTSYAIVACGCLGPDGANSIFILGACGTSARSLVLLHLKRLMSSAFPSLQWAEVEVYSSGGLLCGRQVDIRRALSAASIADRWLTDPQTPTQRIPLHGLSVLYPDIVAGSVHTLQQEIAAVEAVLADTDDGEDLIALENALLSCIPSVLDAMHISEHRQGKHGLKTLWLLCRDRRRDRISDESCGMVCVPVSPGYAPATPWVVVGGAEVVWDGLAGAAAVSVAEGISELDALTRTIVKALNLLHCPVDSHYEVIKYSDMSSITGELQRKQNLEFQLVDGLMVLQSYAARRVAAYAIPPSGPAPPGGPPIADPQMQHLLLSMMEQMLAQQRESAAVLRLIQEKQNMSHDALAAMHQTLQTEFLSLKKKADTAILRNREFPTLLLIVPDQSERVFDIKKLLFRRFRMFCVCPVSGRIGHCGDGRGYRVDVPRDSLRYAVPLLYVGMMALNIALKSFTGFSIDTSLVTDLLPGGMGSLATYLEAATQALEKLQDEVKSRAKDAAKDVVDAVASAKAPPVDVEGIHIHSLSPQQAATSAGVSEMSADRRNAMGDLFEFAKAKMKDGKPTDTGLVLATAKDGETAWVHENFKSYFEEHGAKSLCYSSS